jgi:cytochrome oxidase Cu insertion factor (SCO1/SenC/PrrC family)
MSEPEPGDLSGGADERRAAAAAPPGIPRRAIWIGLALAAVLGIGGAYADHSFDVPPAPSATTVHTTATRSRSLAQFVGLTSLGTKRAPDIVLTAGSGSTFTLASLVGHPVIVTFLPAGCGGICPVVTTELRDAQHALAAEGIESAVVIVNADPRAVVRRPAPPEYATSMLSGLQMATFVDGSLAQLQQVWRSYGVTIELDPQSGALASTDVIYLIDPQGRLRDALTPFANQPRLGAAALPIAEIRRFAEGISTYVSRITR